MTRIDDEAIDVFVDAGVICHREGLLPDALAELCIRLDLTAGDLLHELVNNKGVPAGARWKARRTRRPR